MQKITKVGLLIILITVASSCGNSTDKQKELEKKKAALGNLQTERGKLDEKISSLETEIAKLDTSAATNQKAKLVSISPVTLSGFKHYLELQGTVDDKIVSYVTPTGPGGQVKAIYVKQGDKVRKGQLILKLDDAVALQNVAAVKQQMGSVQAQLDLAKSVYERQKNLWDQNIGTEVQLLQAKTNVESLQNQLKAIMAQANTAQAQANQSNVYSDVNGVVDLITAQVGASFTGNPATGQYISIINKANLKINTIIPENYAGKVKIGTPVEVEIPDINTSFNSSISYLSQTINTTLRGFLSETKVPGDYNLKPNQVAVVRILDYSVPSTVVINVNTLQTDEQGKFVLVAVKEGNKMVARKRKVVIGQLSGDQIEIKQGLQPGEQLITEGYQSLYDGQTVTTTGA